MARKLAHERTANRETDNKLQLNRRGYLRAGLAASAAAFGTGAGFAGTSLGSDETGETFMTDFSEYAQ